MKWKGIEGLESYSVSLQVNCWISGHSLKSFLECCRDEAICLHGCLPDVSHCQGNRLHSASRLHEWTNVDMPDTRRPACVGDTQCPGIQRLDVTSKLQVMENSEIIQIAPDENSQKNPECGLLYSLFKNQFNFC